MNDHDLNREIAQATGESLDTIEALGFSLWTPASPIREARSVPKKAMRTSRPPAVIIKPRPRARSTRTRRMRLVPKIVAADIRRANVLTLDFDCPEGA